MGNAAMVQENSVMSIPQDETGLKKMAEIGAYLASVTSFDSGILANRIANSPKQKAEIERVALIEAEGILAKRQQERVAELVADFDKKREAENEGVPFVAMRPSTEWNQSAEARKQADAKPPVLSKPAVQQAQPVLVKPLGFFGQVKHSAGELVQGAKSSPKNTFGWMKNNKKYTGALFVVACALGGLHYAKIF